MERFSNYTTYQDTRWVVRCNHCILCKSRYVFVNSTLFFFFEDFNLNTSEKNCKYFHYPTEQQQTHQHCLPVYLLTGCLRHVLDGVCWHRNIYGSGVHFVVVNQNQGVNKYCSCCFLEMNLAGEYFICNVSSWQPYSARQMRLIKVCKFLFSARNKMISLMNELSGKTN